MSIYTEEEQEQILKKILSVEGTDTFEHESPSHYMKDIFPNSKRLYKILYELYTLGFLDFGKNDPEKCILGDWVEVKFLRVSAKGKQWLVERTEEYKNGQESEEKKQQREFEIKEESLRIAKKQERNSFHSKVFAGIAIIISIGSIVISIVLSLYGNRNLEKRILELEKRAVSQSNRS